MKKLKPAFVQYRYLIQSFFALTSIYLGIRFINYYLYLETSGLSGSPHRPPGIEAFTPLSALVGLRFWVGTGVFDYVHPAGLTILLAAVLISFLFRKSFCSWICPFGFLEELLVRLAVRVLPKKLKMPRWLDIILRSLKYVLLGFFIGGVFWGMSAEAASSFLNLPYNKVVDIEMLKFFLNISVTGAAVFAFLIIMSILFDHFWCRYLCPYGALLGLVGWFSPCKIERREELCVSCQACDKSCPGHLQVSKTRSVFSPECSGCLECIESCPVPGALEYNFAGRLGSKEYVLPAAMLIIFAAAIILAMATGHWTSSITLDEMTAIYRNIGNI